MGCPAFGRLVVLVTNSALALSEADWERVAVAEDELRPKSFRTGVLSTVPIPNDGTLYIVQATVVVYGDRTAEEVVLRLENAAGKLAETTMLCAVDQCIAMSLRRSIVMPPLQPPGDGCTDVDLVIQHGKTTSDLILLTVTKE